MVYLTHPYRFYTFLGFGFEAAFVTDYITLQITQYPSIGKTVTRPCILDTEEHLNMLN